MHHRDPPARGVLVVLTRKQPPLPREPKLPSPLLPRGVPRAPVREGVGPLSRHRGERARGGLSSYLSCRFYLGDFF